jgi:hypothetical protein
MSARWIKAVNKIRSNAKTGQELGLNLRKRGFKVSPEISMLKEAEEAGQLIRDVSKDPEDGLQVNIRDEEAASPLGRTPSLTKSIIDGSRISTGRGTRALPNTPVKLEMTKQHHGRRASETVMYEAKTDDMNDDEIYKLLQSGYTFKSPVEELIKLDRLNLLARAIEERLVKVNKFEFCEILKTKKTDLAILSMKPTEESGLFGCKFLKDIGVLKQIADLLHCRETILDGLFILSKLVGYEAHQMASRALLYKLKLILIEDRIREEVVMTHWNPILVCVLLSELCDRLTRYSNIGKNQLHGLSEKFRRVAELVQAELNEVEQVKAIYTDTSYHGLNLFDVMVESPTKYRTLLHSPLVSQIIDDFWNGEVNLSFGLHHSSYVYKTLQDIKHPDDLWRVYNSKLRCNNNSYFQFSSWKSCCSVRYFFELLYLAAFIAVIFDTAIKYVQLACIGNKPLSLTVDDITVIEDYDDNIQFMINVLFTPYTLLLTLSFFQVTLYRYVFSGKILLDSRAPINVSLVILLSFIRLSNDGSFKNEHIEYAWGLLGLFLLLRFIIGLSITRTFGQILSMITVIFYDIVPYLCLNLFVILAFALLAHMIFYRADSFSTFILSVSTLFNASVGSFDMNTFDYSQTAEGSTFMSIWIVISNMMLLNLLIAVLSSRYEALAPEAEADYVTLLYTFYKGMAYHLEYGSLVSFPPPFNILQIPLIVLYFLPIKKTRTNEILFNVSYIPMLIFASMIHLINSLALVPFSFCFNLKRILLSKKYTKSGMITRLLLWLFGGVPYLLFLVIISLRSLFSYLYQKPAVEEISDLYPSLIKHLEYIVKLKGPNLTLKLSECSELVTSLPSRSKELIDKLQHGQLNCFEELLFSVMAAKGVSAEEEFASRLRIINKFADFHTREIDLDFTLLMLKTWSHDKIEAANFYLAQRAFSKFADS